MDQLILEVKNLREKCHNYGDNIKKTHSMMLPSDPRSGCFATMFNQATLTLELLSHYYNHWKRAVRVIIPEDLERSRKENAERCLLITKMQFVLGVSAIEHSAKDVIPLYPKHPLAKWYQKQQLKKVRIYLSGIMSQSNAKGLVSNQDFVSWDCLLKVRNSIVHNNAIADFNKTYQVGGLTVSFVKGAMLKDKLDFCVRLLDTAVDLFCSWILELDKASPN